MSSFSIQNSSLLIATISEVPMSTSLLISTPTVSWAEKNTSCSLNGSTSLSNYRKRTFLNRCITNYLFRMLSLFALQLALITCVLSSLGTFNPATYSILLTCLFIMITTRLCVAIQHLRQLNLCKKKFSHIIVSIADKLISDPTTSTKELMPVSNAAKNARKTVNQQIARQRISITGAAIALISVIGLTVGLGLLLASIYGGSCIGCAPVIAGFSATQLLLMTSGSLLGLSAIWHIGMVSNNISRRIHNKQTHHQMKTIISNLAEERKTSSINKNSL